MIKRPRMPHLPGPWARAATHGAAVVGGAVLGVFLLAYCLAGEIYEYQDTVDGVHLPQVDAIVCLAGGRGRIAAAADLWYRYWEQDEKHAPTLFISGMGHQASWNVFAHQIRRGVLGVIRPKYVVLETESENTDANARYMARHGYERGWTRILLITSRYHMRRARFMFEQVLTADAPIGHAPIQIETLSYDQDPFEPGEWRSGILGVHVTVLEYLKWVYYHTFWHP